MDIQQPCRCWESGLPASFLALQDSATTVRAAGGWSPIRGKTWMLPAGEQARTGVAQLGHEATDIVSVLSTGDALPHKSGHHPRIRGGPQQRCQARADDR